MNYRYITQTSDVERILPEIMASKTWGFDVETNGLSAIDDKVVLVQIGNTHKQWLIDARKVNLEPLRPFFESREIRKVCHNGKFDYKFLRSRGIYGECFRDTYLAEQILTAGWKSFGFGLDDLCKTYGLPEMDKGQRDTFGPSFDMNSELTEEQLKYSARDVEVLLPILSSQVNKMTNHNLMRVWQLECEAMPAFGDIEYDGMYINRLDWREAIDRNSADLFVIEGELNLMAASMFDSNEYSGDPESTFHLNWNSPANIIKFLKAAGVYLTQDQEGTLTKQIIKKTDDETLKSIKGVYAIDLLRKYRRLAKRLSTYGESYISAIHPVTGRIHPQFTQLGAKTGRHTSKSGKGNVNVLTIPREYRKFFTGGKGQMVETHDYNACEVRIWAELSGDKKLREIFERGEDVHCYVSSLLFGKEVKKGDPDRILGKTLNFGIVYGMSPKTVYEDLISNGYSITPDRTQELYGKFKTYFKEGMEFLNDCGSSAVNKGYVTSASGRRRYWQKKEKDDSYAIRREAGNFPMQGTNADITKTAMAMIRRHILDNKVPSQLMNQVYDEIVTRTDMWDCEELAEKKCEIMKEAAGVFLKNIPVEVDFVIKERWDKG